LIQIGKLYLIQEDYQTAIEKYKEALLIVPDNAELFTAIGVVYLKVGHIDGALENFNTAINHDSSFNNALLGAASIYQDKYEFESALIKYKLASTSNPNSPLVWNNLGLCFFAKQKYVAAVTCLKRAIYLDPFEWIISYNLGLVYLYNSQYMSAFHHFNCASNIKLDFYLIYMFMGIVLSKLNDIANGINYYERALELDPTNFLVYLNYTISLINHEMYANAKEKFEGFMNNYNRDESSENDHEITEMIEHIQARLYG
jgi:Bardet-Biedl syndrome 4 protein